MTCNLPNTFLCLCTHPITKSYLSSAWEDSSHSSTALPIRAPFLHQAQLTCVTTGCPLNLIHSSVMAACPNKFQLLAKNIHLFQ